MGPMIQVSRIVNSSREYGKVVPIWLNVERIVAIQAIENPMGRYHQHYDLARWTVLEFPQEDGDVQQECVTESVETVLDRLAQVGVAMAPPAPITPLAYRALDD
jgi:hypothetical protein